MVNKLLLVTTWEGRREKSGVRVEDSEIQVSLPRLFSLFSLLVPSFPDCKSALYCTGIPLFDESQTVRPLRGEVLIPSTSERIRDITSGFV
jgi:hypothetical protein